LLSGQSKFVSSLILVNRLRKLILQFYIYTMNQSTIRTIQPADNPHISRIIKDALTEFGANRPGTVYTDPTTNALYELFQKEGAIYYIAESNGVIVGGGGIYPTEGLPADTCELVKMYLSPTARGCGLGKALIEKSMAFAKGHGYQNLYLESMPELKQALKVYAKFGFEYLSGPMGNSGHTGCSLWMLRRVAD
jgi:putative acetyltransferase